MPGSVVPLAMFGYCFKGAAIIHISSRNTWFRFPAVRNRNGWLGVCSGCQFGSTMRINGRLMGAQVDPEQYTFFGLTDRVSIHATYQDMCQK